MDHTMRLWDAVNGKVLTSLSLPAVQFGEVGLAWSPDGNLLAIGTSGNQIQLVDKTGKNVATLSKPNEVNYLRWAADGKTLLSVLKGGTIHTWQK